MQTTAAVLTQKNELIVAVKKIKGTSIFNRHCHHKNFKTK
jgi:hypothetical protein